MASADTYADTKRLKIGQHQRNVSTVYLDHVIELKPSARWRSLACQRERRQKTYQISVAEHHRCHLFKIKMKKKHFLKAALHLKGIEIRSAKWESQNKPCVQICLKCHFTVHWCPAWILKCVYLRIWAFKPLIPLKQLDLNDITCMCVRVWIRSLACAQMCIVVCVPECVSKWSYLSSECCWM